MASDPSLVETSDPFTFKLRIDTSEAEAAMDRLREKAEAALAAIKAAKEAAVPEERPASKEAVMYAEAMARMS